jgi:Tfp pilus assembly protein PilZ
VLEGTVLTETGDVACRVLAKDANGLTVRVGKELRTQGTLRLAFDHDGATAGVVRLLAAVEGTDAVGDEMDVHLRHLALHSTAGRACLREFLEGPLGIDAIDEAAFKEGAGGWFYGFHATRPAARDAVKRKASSTAVIVESDRREQRVAVRVQVQVKHGARSAVCQAYNISASGVYVMSEDLLPGVGAEVEVVYPVALHAKPFNVRLFGAVVWEMPAMTSTRGGGLGIKLSRIDDGAGGEAWREYVQREVEFGGAVKGR